MVYQSKRSLFCHHFVGVLVVSKVPLSLVGLEPITANDADSSSVHYPSSSFLYQSNCPGLAREKGNAGRLASYEPTLQAGAEIRNINGHTVPALWRAMELMNRGDTEEVDRLRINQNLPYYFWLAYGGSEKYSLILADGQQVELTGIPLRQLSERKGSTKVPEDIVHVRYPNDSTAVLYIRNFYHASKKYYKKSFDAVFKELRDTLQVKYLLIDNRFNDGDESLQAIQPDIYVPEGTNILDFTLEYISQRSIKPQ
jgi:hypothetical protein